MPRTAGPEKVRLNLEVTPEVRARLEKLRDRTEAETLTEVFRRALGVYEMLAEHYAKDGSVILLAPDGTRERLRIA
jgi:hypothetical protein